MMWRSLWTSTDRFSLQRFKYLVHELQVTKVVDKQNNEFVVDILRSIVEIVTYGDQRDTSIFECFMEYQILAEFLRVLKISRNSSIEAPLLHYLSIMIQNLACEHSVYYCLSNEYINNIILHKYDFDGGDLAHYYVSFLRTVSGKLNRDTICLLVKVQEGIVVSFPLYSEALKFARHEEKMIQIAVRSLTLNTYNASDDMVYTYITTPPASDYFLDLILNLREQCIHLDALVTAAKDRTCEMRKVLLPETDKIIDDLYYCNDILRVGKYCLSTLLAQNLLKLLILPILLPSLQLSQTVDSHESVITSLYIVCRLLQIIDGKELVNSVAVALLYPYLVSRIRGDTDKGTTSGAHPANCIAVCSNEMEEMDISAHDPEGAENIDKTNLSRHLSEYISSNSHFFSVLMDDIQSKRDGILPLIFSENHSHLLASLMFLIILSENEGLDCLLSSAIGFTKKKKGMELRMPSDTSLVSAMDGNIFSRHMSQILTALLKVLVSKPPFSAPTQWNTGWILWKLLRCQEKKLTDQDIYLFRISSKKSSERLLKEFDGCWFDYIPVTLENEWEKCKIALEESSQSKDPFFVLELSFHKPIPDGGLSSSLAWQRMVDTIQVFVLHHLLDAFIFERDYIENPFRQLSSASVGTSGITDGVDLLSATYGTRLGLDSGIPSKIAFSRREQRDVYLIPVAKGISGKLLLAEKLPLHTHQGVVIAIAPLAGLSPVKDDNHPSWLHLQVREFDPRVHASKTSGYHANASDQVVDGRWTLGFPNAEACDAAVSLILRASEMSGLSKLRTGLTVVFVLSIFALLAQLYYVLWRRRRFQRQTHVLEPDVSGEPTKELLYFFCWKNQSRIEPSGAPAINHPGDDEPSEPGDLLKLYGSSRVLFTIKEEEREELESEKSLSEWKIKRRGVSLEESQSLEVTGDPTGTAAVVIDVESETPFSTPCASPPYYTPPPSPPPNSKNLTHSLETDDNVVLRDLRETRFPAEERVLQEA